MKKFGKTLIVIFLLCFFLPGSLLIAQKGVKISGRILNAKTKKPIADVNVYLAGSTAGSSSDKNGYYRITGLRSGVYKIIVSSIGYKRIIEDIRVAGNKEYQLSFFLVPQIYQLPTVIIDEEEQKLWKDRLDKFILEFIGQSGNAERCRLENPYVLEFKEKEGSLIAEASEPLIITNYALGFKIKYFLEFFSYKEPNTIFKGQPVFFELQPVDEDEKNDWDFNRLKTYCGSLRHFLRTASNDWDEIEKLKKAGLSDSLEDRTSLLERQGFLVYYFKYFNQYRRIGQYMGIDTELFIFPTENDYEKIISFKDELEIVYDRKLEDPNYLDFIYENRWPAAPVAQIYLHADSVRFDTRGRYFDQFKIQTFAYWAFLRLADMLPFEYNPPDSVLESVFFEE